MNEVKKAPVAALFVSDVHLQEDMPRTAEAFLALLAGPARAAKWVYILGDLFEYWAGDDDDSPFLRQVADALRELTRLGTSLYWIGGNRDFLLGQAFAERVGLNLLQEACTINLTGEPIILTHGDALCTDDTAYMAFRAQVRTPAWQAAFLAQPLAKRKEIIAGLREGSKAAQKMKTAEIMDVNAAAVAALFSEFGAATMIHGHTHRPALHEVGGKKRYVLPDWDCDGAVKRGGWIVLREDGEIERVDLATT